MKKENVYNIKKLHKRRSSEGGKNMNAELLIIGLEKTH